jgi:glycosyltransferase 2 family protein
MTGDLPDAQAPAPRPSEHEHHALYEAEEFLGAPPNEVIPEQEVSLARRFLNVRTIGSIVFGIAMLVLLFRFGLNVQWGETWGLILHANGWFLLAALAVYYATFPIRGYRWAFILGRVGTKLRLAPATEILFLSWFVNCLVPAKLGDLYRAYLLKGNYGASASRTVGTVFIERIADLIVIAALALAAGFWSFRGRQRPEIDLLFLVGFVVAAALVIFVVALRFLGGRVTRFLPARLADLYQRFHEGSTGALTARSLPVILLLTGVIWLLEGARVFFVIHALDLPDVHLGISASVFVALAAALLTAIPLTPAGVGFVEAGIIGALLIYGVPSGPAAAVALTDRAISILTVIVLGGILYAFSGMVRRAHGAGRRPPVSVANGASGS